MEGFPESFRVVKEVVGKSVIPVPEPCPLCISSAPAILAVCRQSPRVQGTPLFVRHSIGNTGSFARVIIPRVAWLGFSEFGPTREGDDMAMLIVERGDRRLNCILKSIGGFINCRRLPHRLEVPVHIGGIEEEVDIWFTKIRVPKERPDPIRRWLLLGL